MLSRRLAYIGNLPKALMKPYFDAGLKQLAKKAGYPTATIQACSQFKRTHCFIIEEWEAIFLAMFHMYLENAQHAGADLGYFKRGG